MKTILLFRRGLSPAFLLIHALFFGQLFNQDFESSSNVSTYINLISRANGQFNALGSSGVSLRPLNSGANSDIISRTQFLPVEIYTGTSIASSPNAFDKDISLNGEVAQPLILINSAPQDISLSGFAYDFAQGPSPTQSFRIDGANLNQDISVTASPDWEISSNQTYDGSNSYPWMNVVFSKSLTGTVTNKTIHVRLKDGLPVGLYTGTLSLTSADATTRTVTLSGQVTAGIREIKVTGKGTSIANGSVNPSGLNNTLFASQNLGNFQTKSYEIKNLGGAPLTIDFLSISGVDASSFTILNGPALGVILNQNQIATFDINFAPTTIGTKNATISITNDDPNDNPYVFAIRGGATYCSPPDELIVARQNFEVSPATPVLNYTLTTFGTIAPGPNTGFSSGKSGSTSLPKNNNLYSDGLRGYRIQGNDPLSEIPSGVLFTFDDVNTSGYTNVSLSFKVAGFSLGSTSNGMDDLNAMQVSTPIHGDKLDYLHLFFMVPLLWEYLY